MTDTIHKQSSLHAEEHKPVFVDPVCGMFTDEPDTYQELEHGDKTYYFCSDHCLTKFEANPADFIKPAEDNLKEDALVNPSEFQDPICGMTTDDPDAYQPYEHNGKTYHFCSDHCLTKFKTDPEGYISGKKQEHTDDGQLQAASIPVQWILK